MHASNVVYFLYSCYTKQYLVFLLSITIISKLHVGWNFGNQCIALSPRARSFLLKYVKNKLHEIFKMQLGEFLLTYNLCGIYLYMLQSCSKAKIVVRRAWALWVHASTAKFLKIKLFEIEFMKICKLLTETYSSLCHRRCWIDCSIRVTHWLLY